MTTPPFIQPPLDIAIHKGAWAKFDHQSGESMPLTRHLDDAACVAAQLWDHWLPQHSQDLISTHFSNNDELARKLAIFLTAGHDIGKHSLAFAGKIDSLKERIAAHGGEFIKLNPSEGAQSFHSLFSAESLITWLAQRNPDGNRQARESLATIVAGHHGSFPSFNLVQPRTNRALSREARKHWAADRFVYWDRAAKTAGLDDGDIIALTQAPLPAPAQMILCGFVIMADWISSNTDFFPLIDQRSSSDRARDAIKSLRFPPHWTPAPDQNSADLFRSSFSLPENASPRPVQIEAMRMAREVPSPCLMLIEAPTGEGKTEAAFAAAEILASRFGLNGITAALPTCATSDAMLPRFMSWLDRRLPADMQAGTLLSHGKAQFNDEYQAIFYQARGDFSGIYDDDISDEDSQTHRNFRPHWWFTGRKTSALADFSVGTIDQILFAALRTKHLALRHLGLSNKVVILDEIHSADAYMAVYLKRTLEWLGAMGIPVIALSATLAPQQRSDLLEAYRSGSMIAIGKKSKEAAAISFDQHVGYPLLSAVTATGLLVRDTQPSSRSSQFTLDYLELDSQDFIESVIKESSHGGCIGVVCNTVNRAQKIYRALKDRCSDSTELILLHSRFLGYERRRIEKDLVDRLGPDSTDRPHNMIVVSTQIIEQSMDIDFDVLFSDIAPIDLIFQRVGRLHRHKRAPHERPVAHHSPRVHIAACSAPDAQLAPTLDPGSTAVYGRAPLLRTLAVLLKHGPVLRSPGDVASLVAAAYSDDPYYPESWAAEFLQAEEKAQIQLNQKISRAQQSYLQVPPDTSPVWLQKRGGTLEAREERAGGAQVRDIEDALEVIVVVRDDHGLKTLNFAPERADEYINFGHLIDEQLSKVLARSIVSLPFWVLKDETTADALLDALEQDVLTATEVEVLKRNKWLRDQLFLALDADLEADIAGYHVAYSREYGLTVEKI
ncbi:CRISPR-associated helicase Cas3' [Corynebacterium sp. ES2715-CONJ3]|uniref:CRISPR-associated helicase Cas3' n=1 Tax=Corynebacterium sp. ES2715-CONJ3 TaxID=2974028 RepID=UPI0021690372|nr:CRISPR-associated helicase Cas3' [Corynebacterium sp. ES2715-CONJ3]MCS4492467.1 CRISPR-associated helicase Cas3' [Corynebacterium sp. ES2715-CONJ3]